MARRDRNGAKGESVGAGADGSNALMPHELMLKIARGETIDGHKPTFKERFAAAKQALPYYAPRRAPEKGEDQGPLIVNVRRFSDGGGTEGRDAGSHHPGQEAKPRGAGI